MKNFKVGIQLYSLRNEMKESVENTFRRVSEMGYEYLEFAGYFDKTAEELCALMDKYGLKCRSIHQKQSWFLENPDEAIAFVKKLGVKYSAVPWYDKRLLVGTEAWPQTVEAFTKAGRLLRDNGMQLLYHNHDFEFAPYEGKYIFDHLIEAIPDDLLLPEFDVCWVRYGGEDPCRYIRKYAGKVDCLHLKDFYAEGCKGEPVYNLIDDKGKVVDKKPAAGGFEYRPLGKGVQDFPSILAAAEEAGTKYLIFEQDESPAGTAFECADISRKYLRSLGI